MMNNELPNRPDAKPRWPRFLIDLLGVDYFRNAVYACISTHATDADLINLERLSKLEAVELENLPNLDAALKHLRTLRCLESLDMNNSQVSDVGLANLNGLVTLRNLFLNHTSVTDTGLAHIKELPRSRFWSSDGRESLTPG